MNRRWLSYLQKLLALEVASETLVAMSRMGRLSLSHKRVPLPMESFSIAKSLLFFRFHDHTGMYLHPRGKSAEALGAARSIQKVQRQDSFLKKETERKQNAKRKKRKQIWQAYTSVCITTTTHSSFPVYWRGLRDKESRWADMGRTGTRTGEFETHPRLLYSR